MKISKKELIEKNPLLNPHWRINNLYQIVNKQGQQQLFKLNWAQERLYKDIWYMNVILKARQLGISTFICMLFLDRCLFNPNKAAGIIAHTREDAQHMFRRVKFAYDLLPKQIKNFITCDNDTSEMLNFSNGSSIRIGTSLRSSTFQYLHISEFGKICAKFPEKAEEIVTGSLNTVAAGQYTFIESTAEGREGYFYDICKAAQARKNQKLSELEFKFHFFPWWGDDSYRSGSCLPMDQDTLDYFDHLKNLNINLDEQQKNWYVARRSTQGENMRREYPSTPDESWEQSNEGRYYYKLISTARAEKRIGFIPYDPQLPVNTAWDLGYNDSNAIWYFQIQGNEIRIIDYDEGSGESLAHWLGIVKSKEYIYDKHIGPHDIMVHEYSSGMTRQASARKMGFNIIPAQKVEIIPGIDAVRNILNRCWFDEEKCSKGIKALENYKKDWDDRNGCWRSQPLHNWASHGADAFRTLATGLVYITKPNTANHNPNIFMQNKYNITRSF